MFDVSSQYWVLGQKQSEIKHDPGPKVYIKHLNPVLGTVGNQRTLHQARGF